MEKIIKIGTVTIGQSPRIDITSEIAPMLGEKFKLFEKGALDNLTAEYILENIAPKNNEDVLVSRMKDGTQVRIDKNKIIHLIQEKIHEFDEMEVDIIVLLCNEKFPEFEHKTLLFKPEEIGMSWLFIRDERSSHERSKQACTINKNHNF